MSTSPVVTFSLYIAFLALAAGISLMAGSGPGLYLTVPVILYALPASGWMAWQVVFAPETRLKR